MDGAGHSEQKEDVDSRHYNSGIYNISEVLTSDNTHIFVILMLVFSHIIERYLRLVFSWYANWYGPRLLDNAGANVTAAAKHFGSAAHPKV